MIPPIAFAISPDVPESISSKTKVGKFTFFARIDFKANKILDFSPPEATLDKLSAFELLLDENKT